MSSAVQNSASNRIQALLDENSFVEIGARVTARATDFDMKSSETPADGVVTGYGVIDGNLVYVYSQDASVLGGSVGEMHAKKIVRLYELAMKVGAPVIGLVDCAGLRLQEATDALNGFGEIYLKQTLASGVIPQITAILGNCGGGLAVMPAITDFTLMEEKSGKLFVNTPNALAGNSVAKCDTASASFQSETCGTVDFVGDEATIFAKIRELVAMLPANNEDDLSYEECNDDLNRTSSDLANCAGDTSILLSKIADDEYFLETKAMYAKEMVTGFIKLNGVTVGCVANRSEVYGEEGLETKYAKVLTPAGCEKAAEFINFCDAFDIPVLSVTNVTGFSAEVEAEKSMAKSVAKLTYAFANASVPKVNVITTEAFGSAYVAMNSKAIGADIVYAWEDAKIGMMDAKLAAKIMYEGEGSDVIDAKAKEYENLQNSVDSAAARGYVDSIISAADTRKYVVGALEMLFTKREDRPFKKHGAV